MNYKEIPAELYNYCKNVLGIHQAIRPYEPVQVKDYPRLVIFDEEMAAGKQVLMEKILTALSWTDVEQIPMHDLPSSVRIQEAFVFGRHLEDELKKNYEIGQALYAPSIQDLIDEPSLKKTLWAEMKAYMGSKA